MHLTYTLTSGKFMEIDLLLVSFCRISHGGLWFECIAKVTCMDVAIRANALNSLGESLFFNLKFSSDYCKILLYWNWLWRNISFIQQVWHQWPIPPARERAGDIRGMNMNDWVLETVDQHSKIKAYLQYNVLSAMLWRRQDMMACSEEKCGGLEIGC